MKSSTGRGRPERARTRISPTVQSLGLAVLGTAAQHRIGSIADPPALTDGYALGLTLGALLVGTGLIAALVLTREAR